MNFSLVCRANVVSGSFLPKVRKPWFQKLAQVHLFMRWRIIYVWSCIPSVRTHSKHLFLFSSNPGSAFNPNLSSIFRETSHMSIEQTPHLFTCVASLLCVVEHLPPSVILGVFLLLWIRVHSTFCGLEQLPPSVNSGGIPLLWLKQLPPSVDTSNYILKIWIL